MHLLKALSRHRLFCTTRVSVCDRRHLREVRKSLKIMAKSIRSKFRRKMRNLKRDKYGQRELERLKGILGDGKDLETKEIYKVKTAAELKQKDQAQEDDSKMEHSGKIFDPKTRKDANGHYPGWMNQRAIHKHKKILKNKSKKKKGKK